MEESHTKMMRVYLFLLHSQVHQVLICKFLDTYKYMLSNYEKQLHVLFCIMFIIIIIVIYSWLVYGVSSHFIISHIMAVSCIGGKNHRPVASH